MTEDDVGDVFEIEKDLFTLPWSRNSFLYEVTGNSRSYAIVATSDGAIVGYALGWFVLDEFHIGNVAVIRAMQGKGLGKELLANMLQEAAARKVALATLEVRVSNVRAIRLYREHGFKGVAMRRGYYTDTGEDALVMLAELQSEEQA